MTVPILKPIYLELNKKLKDKLGLVITGPSGSGSVAGITQYSKNKASLAHSPSVQGEWLDLLAFLVEKS